MHTTPSQGQKSELWSLAHRHAVSASRHPEACCVLGNALAAAGDHTRAAHALAKAARMGDKAASITPARMGCSRSAECVEHTQCTLHDRKFLIDIFRGSSYIGNKNIDKNIDKNSNNDANKKQHQ